MIIPYRVDVPMFRHPVANYVLIGFTVFVSMLVFGEGEFPRSMVLDDDWELTGLFGHVLLHAGLIHLIGNMLFLWVFGNAVCAKIGNIAYVPVYFALGLVAAVIHLLFDGGAAVGASGAINGIVGMFLIWYPLNEISCVVFIYLRPISFSLSSGWMILFWLIFDIWGAVAGGDGSTAYWAHLGGFFGGAVLAAGLLKLNVVEMDDSERSLLDVLGA